MRTIHRLISIGIAAVVCAASTSVAQPAPSAAPAPTAAATATNAPAPAAAVPGWVPPRPDPKHLFTLRATFYPKESLKHDEEGDCAIRIEIDPTGQIDVIQLVISTGYPRLDGACMRAVPNERMLPATSNGVPASGWFTLPESWRIHRAGYREAPNLKIPDGFRVDVPTLADNQPLRVGAEFVPAAARNAHFPALCAVRITVTSEGNLLDAALIERSGNEGIDQACIQAVREAKYSPAIKNGAAVTASTDFYMIWR